MIISRFTVATIATVLFSFSAFADELPDVTFENGAFEIRQASVLAGAHAKPMQQLGADSVRFTFDPGSSLMIAEVFELRDEGPNAHFDVKWLGRSEGGGWHVIRARSFRISSWQYRLITSAIDEQLARGKGLAARIDVGEEPSVLCVDGFDLVTERNQGGATSWMEGDCGDQPNHVIRALLNDWALQYLGTQ